MTDESGWEVHGLPTEAGRPYGTARAVNPNGKSFMVRVQDGISAEFDGTSVGFERVVLEMLHDTDLQDSMLDLWHGENTVVRFLCGERGGVIARPPDD